MFINGVNFSNNKINNKINFNANPFRKKQQPTQQQSDWFENSEEQQNTKKKKAPIINFYKKAQEKSAEIIRTAQTEASKIITQAYDTSREIRERAERYADDQKKLKEQELECSMRTRRIQEEEKLREYLDSMYASRKREQEQECAALENRQIKLESAIKASNQKYINKEIKKRKEEYIAQAKSYTLDYDYSEALKEQGSVKSREITGEKINFSNYPFTPIKKVEEKTLDIPEFTIGESWSYQIPANKPIKLPEYTRLPFEEMKNKETNISMNYADSIRWRPDKIARDLMQNFFDGHNQTLDGVRLSFEPMENGRYKIRIEGNAKYTQEKAILLGESTKRNNAKAAGNFGEGLKVVVLKLLKEYGAQEVNIASDNWKVTYKPTKSSICNQDVLSYSLSKVDEIDGNYIEFETDNETIPIHIVNSINNFYHSGNPDFQNLDFENEKFAIKKLKPNEKGSIYISGQKFEYSRYSWDLGWQEIPGMHIILKEKPNDLAGFDISRDRIMLNKDNLKAIFKYIARYNTSTKDCCDLMNLFKEYWTKEEFDSFSQKKEIDELFASILKGIGERGEKFEFPDFYLASSSWGKDSGKDLFYKKTHSICKSEFKNIGMKSVDEQYLSDKYKRVVEPDAKQIQKIKLIKETLACLKPHIEPVRRDRKTISYNPNIYIFKDNMAFSGEHIKDGFWISESALCGSFESIITTALHEISHVAGGDGSMEFTYELTNMLKGLMSATMDDQGTLTNLRALKAAWDEINFF